VLLPTQHTTKVGESHALVEIYLHKGKKVDIKASLNRPRATFCRTVRPVEHQNTGRMGRLDLPRPHADESRAWTVKRPATKHGASGIARNKECKRMQRTVSKALPVVDVDPDQRLR
jgi:hypothetical protein